MTRDKNPCTAAGVSLRWRPEILEFVGGFVAIGVFHSGTNLYGNRGGFLILIFIIGGLFGRFRLGDALFNDFFRDIDGCGGDRARLDYGAIDRDGIFSETAGALGDDDADAARGVGTGGWIDIDGRRDIGTVVFNITLIRFWDIPDLFVGDWVDGFGGVNGDFELGFGTFGSERVSVFIEDEFDGVDAGVL